MINIYVPQAQGQMRLAKSIILGIIEEWAIGEWEMYGKRKPLDHYRNAMKGDTKVWCMASAEYTRRIIGNMYPPQHEKKV